MSLSADRSTPRNFLTACVLLLLKEAPAHGYELLQRLHNFDMGHDTGRLYRTLRALEEEGLVRSGWETGNGHERRSYVLTPAGNAWLESCVNHVEGHRRTLDRFASRYRAAVQARVAALVQTRGDHRLHLAFMATFGSNA